MKENFPQINKNTEVEPGKPRASSGVAKFARRVGLAALLPTMAGLSAHGQEKKVSDGELLANNVKNNLEVKATISDSTKANNATTEFYGAKPTENAKVKKDSVEAKETKTIVTDKVRMDWHKYLVWLEAKGMRGNPALDRDSLGFKLLEEYIKENPETSLSKDMIRPIQEEFKKYREWLLEQRREGKAVIGQDAQHQVPDAKVMPDLSITDGNPGQYTTSHDFATSTLQTLNSKFEVVKVEDKGFSKITSGASSGTIESAEK
jgi:hypothetical protein